MRKQTLVTVHLLVNSTKESEVADGLSALLTETGGQSAYGQPHLITDWGYPRGQQNGHKYGKTVNVEDEGIYVDGDFYKHITT